MSNKKKILIFSIGYYPHVGGAEVAWKEITDRIDEFEFHIIGSRLDFRLPKEEKIGNIYLHRVGFGWKKDTYFLPFLGVFKALKLHRKHDFSLIVGIIYNQASLAAAFFKLLKPKIPFLLNLQDGDTDEVINKKTRGLKKILSIIYKKPDIVTVIAKFLKDRALKNGSTNNIKVIPNGVDVNLFDKEIDSEKINNLQKELNLSPNDKIVITTSRLNYKNAVDDLILSLRYLEPEYKLLILGEGEERNKLIKIVEDNQLQAQVKFLGFKPHEEMLSYLKISQVFCRPSLQEGLGNSFLEAMAAGVPIVATPVGGIPDFLADRKTGLFCEVRNPENIAERIKELAGNEKLRKEIISNGQILVKNNYDWEIIAKKYRETINSVI